MNSVYPRPPQRRRKLRWLLPVMVIVLIYILYAAFRPVSGLTTTLTPPVIPAQIKVALPWPGFGEQAIGADGYGLLASNGAQTPLPTASVAKVITALAVLRQKPLSLGQQGPILTLGSQDIALYHDYVAKNGSVVPVAMGEQISQYQALQALLLPSGNNIADSLAVWAFGSMKAYTEYANDLVRKLGMSQTNIADASGFAPASVSTASDLIRLADAAYDNPVLAEIVGQKTADIPQAGTVRNVNALLGQSGIVGIKTGNTDENPGVFLAAAKVQVGGKPLTIFIAITKAPDLMQAGRFSTTHQVRTGRFRQR